jgi:phosphoribosylamine--glycine ligase
MNVLVLGHGGREHALVDALHRSDQVKHIFVLNGNPGMLKLAKPLFGSEDVAHIVSLCKKHHIEMVIPGGETYLTEGVADTLHEEGITCFGPKKNASLIESSKAYAKSIMETYQVPTGAYQVFHDYENAYAYVKTYKPPYVIKYDGLAFGKGVTIAKTLDEAKDVLYDLLVNHVYGQGKVIIEEFLEGEEYSMICMVHHETIVPLPLAKDHKPRYEKNKGPNTGGMGAYSPVDFVDEKTKAQSLEMMRKVALGMVKEGNPFTGFLYGGFILTKDGPKIIEFNCRLGDPEAEVILPKIKSDLVHSIKRVLDHETFEIDVFETYHLGFVMVSDGYPGTYLKKQPLEIKTEIEDEIYHMGTILEDGKLLTNGGRVLFIRGQGNTLEEARLHAYKKVSYIKADHLLYRHDIGKKQADLD